MNAVTQHQRNRLSQRTWLPLSSRWPACQGRLPVAGTPVVRTTFPLRILRGLFVSVLCLVSCAGVTAAAQQGSLAEQALLARAQAFASRSQLDMAVQAWNQVLLSDPDNQEALAGIARAEMQLGHRGQAEIYLDRLRRLGSDAKLLQQIQSMPQAQPPAQRLQTARQLADKGQYAAALSIYRSLYGDDPPAGDIALAYADTEAAIPAEHDRGVAALRSLAQRFPADPRYAITLGRALTYTPATRSEGIAILQRYSDFPAAQSALQQAQAWQQTAAEAAARTADSEETRLAAAYRALNHGSLAQARDQFLKLLARNSADPRALTGLGYVFMKQGNFAAAERSFQRAQAAGASGLQDKITAAQFSQRIATGAAELQAGATEAAIQDLRAATALEPQNPAAWLALAGALWKAGQNGPAATAFANVLHLAPDRAEAWRGLFLTQSAAGDPRAALATDQHMPPSLRERLHNDPEYLRTLAASQLAAGLQVDYQRVVNHALGLCSPLRAGNMPMKGQMQCADLLVELHQNGAAAAVLQQIIAAAPEDAPAWLLLAVTEHRLQRDDAALATVGHMPQPVLTQLSHNPEFLQLMGSIDQSRKQWALARGWLQRAIAVSVSPSLALELQLADVDLAMGRLQEATTISRRAVQEHPDDPAPWRSLLTALHQAGCQQEALREWQAMPTPLRLRLQADPAFLPLLASIQSSTGQVPDAVQTLDHLAAIYAAHRQTEPADLLLQSGWVYLEADDDARLRRVIAQLGNADPLSSEQCLQRRRLLMVWSLRRASSLAQAGHRRQAIALLEAATHAFPGETSIQDSLAGLYLQDAEPARAFAMYQSLDAATANPSQFQVAIGSAMAAGQTKQASLWLHSALARFPHQASLLKVAGDYEQYLGRSGPAYRYYRAALRALAQPAQEPPTDSAAANPPANTTELDNHAAHPQPQATALAAQSAGPVQSMGPVESAGIVQTLDDAHSVGNLLPLLRLLAANQTLADQTVAPQHAAGPAPPAGGPSVAPQPSATLDQQISRQLHAIQAQFSPWIGANADGDYRSGQPGYDQLFSYAALSEESATLGSWARVTLIAGPIRLDSGTARVASPLRLGTLPATAIPTPQMASGVAGEVQLHADNFAAYFGTTPRGFPVVHWTGGLLLQPQAAHLTLTLARTPIQDSQLAYSGLRDEGSTSSLQQGSIWGGVIANSAELQIVSGGAKSGWYLQGGYQYITGHHVPTNRRADGDLGAYWTAWRRPASGSLTVGINFFGMHYARNLYDFTYGQGGYFSPQAFAIAGVPVNLTGRSRRHWNYKASGSLGVQAFYQASTPYFPLDPALQSAQGNLYFPASTTISANYSFSGELSYVTHHHWYLGAYADFNNTRDYAESRANLFLRYVFASQENNGESAPTGLFPTTGYRPIRVP
ncbi:MAG: cellulose synthase subunit BcsC-related outer membrane protein [Acidobacteriaceae bacterium]